MPCATCRIHPAPKFERAAPEARSAAVTHESGNPPAEIPVIVPVPLIEMGILDYRVRCARGDGKRDPAVNRDRPSRKSVFVCS